MEEPPGSESWCIGCMGPALSTQEPDQPAGRTSFPTPPVGIADSPNTLVQPRSLYAAQLYERLHATPIVLGKGPYRLVNTVSGLTMGVPAGSVYVDQETYTGATSQQWNLISLGNGVYSFTNVASGLYLDVNSKSKAAGAALDVYKNDGATNQQFTFETINDASYIINNVNSGLRVVVEGYSKTPGAAVVQDNLEEHWRFFVP